jgi:hypothetical protein
MLEILLLYNLGKAIASKARSKGRSGPVFVVMLLFLWIFGELNGLLFGRLLSFKLELPHSAYFCVSYGSALAGAAIGCYAAFLIVASIPPRARGIAGPAPDLNEKAFD